MMKIFLRKISILSILVFGLVASAYAAIDGQTFTKYVCDQSANNTVDLSLDVVKNGFTPDGGKWDLVDNSVTDPTSYDPNTQQLQADVSNVFVMSGKLPGIYKFVFTATGSNACIPVNTRVMAVVVILEAPKPISHTIVLCTGDTKDLDLNTIISSTLPATSYSLTATTSGVTLNNSTLQINDTFTGDVVVDYSVAHTDINGADLDVCEGPAQITVKVIRDGVEPSYTGVANVNYCIDEFPATINLNDQLAVTANNGTWTSTPGSGTTGSVAISNSVATFSGVVPGDSFQFQYGYGATTCYSAGTLSFTITVSDDLSADFNDKEVKVCKANNPSQVIDMLRDGLGVGIPLSSGNWSTISEVSNIDVTDGMFEVAQAAAGDYKYNFKVSTAAALCGLAGKSASLTLRVIDTSNVQDGRVEFCVTDLANQSGDITLADYIPGLPSGATWSATGFTITNGQLPYADLNAQGAGTHKLTYSYDTGSCGIVSGDLFVTVTDELDMADTYTLKYCRPDMPSVINLNQAIGIGVQGTWALTSGNANLVVNEFSEINPSSITGDQTYVLTFTPASNNCGAKTTTVTIVVTNDEF